LIDSKVVWEWAFEESTGKMALGSFILHPGSDVRPDLDCVQSEPDARWTVKAPIYQYSKCGPE